MLKSKLIFAAVFLSVFTDYVSAFNTADWKYKADIALQSPPGQMCKFVLTSQVYDVARTDLEDIRIANAAGEEVPFVLIEPKDIEGQQKYTPQVLDRSEEAGGISSLTLDFGAKIMKNTIEVETAGSDFCRAVRVEGSDDNAEFLTLVECAYVFAVGGKYGDRFSRIDLPDNDLRYLRIIVAPMPKETEPVFISRVNAFRFEKKPVLRQEVSAGRLDQREDPDWDSSVYVYDLGFVSLPVSEFKLDVDGLFYRYVIIEGRDAVTQRVKVDSGDNKELFKELAVPWQPVASGVIYRYISEGSKKCEKLFLDVPRQKRAYRYIRLTIKNYDDKPLKVGSLSASIIPHEVLFDAAAGGSFSLYVGSESALSPGYDLGQRLGDPRYILAAPARLGPVVQNIGSSWQGSRQRAWAKEHKVLLFATLVLVVVVLAGFVFRLFKAVRG